MKLTEAVLVKKGQNIFAYSQPFKVNRIEKRNRGKDIYFVQKDGRRVYYRAASLMLKTPAVETAEQIQSKLNQLPGAPPPRLVFTAVPPQQNGGKIPQFDIEVEIKILRPTAAQTRLLAVTGAGMFVGDSRYYADIPAKLLGSVLQRRLMTVVEMAKGVAVVMPLVEQQEEEARAKCSPENSGSSPSTQQEPSSK